MRYKFLLYIALLLVPSVTWANVNNSSCNKKQDFEVIDMHTHVFNLRYLPLEGIIDAKLSSYNPLPVNLSRLMAELFYSITGDYVDGLRGKSAFNDMLYAKLKAVNLLTEPNALSIYSILKELMESKYELLEEFKIQEKEINQFIVNEIIEENKSPKNLTFTNNVGSHERDATLTEYFSRFDQEMVNSEYSLLSFGKLNRVEIENRIQQHELPFKLLALLKKALDVPGKIDGYLYFVLILVQSEDNLIKFMMDEYCEVGIFVHHLMDLEKTYNDIPKIYYTDQIVRSKNLSAIFPQNKLIFFSAVDPFRREEAMRFLDEAKKSGAKGIKFYPPSGYRPSDTVIPDFSQSIFMRIKEFFFGASPMKKQWNSRYKNYEASAINKKNLEFFKKAIEEDLIVFSHHTLKGFEAEKGYGKLFSEPNYWKEVLQKYPKLKLIIGHSGGGEGWFGEFEGSFAQQAYNLCVSYENVYCEFGYFDEVFDKDKRDQLRKNLISLINSQTHETESKTTPRIYPIHTKILYGSDWTMIAKEAKWREYISEFKEVFTKELEPYKENFFAKNARKLLFSE